MLTTELQNFVDAAKDRGAGDEFLAGLLVRRGWPAGDAYDAIAGWWERTTGVALPMRRSGAENARDAFLYLLSFSTLATWASALGSLWFALIEHWLPDVVEDRSVFFFRSMVTWQMAAIVVALPIYLFVTRVILREIRANPERGQSGVCKWLTYIAMLLAALGVVSDLVVFVDFFLKGELTARFVLKCVVVMAICGSIFLYYVRFLRGQAPSRVFAMLGAACATVAVMLGMTAVGSPAAQRHIEADNRRMGDLRAIAIAVHSMPTLPQSLSELRARRPDLRVLDPETRAPYEYTAKTGAEYELCATFAAPGDPVSAPARNGLWSHGAGRTCFAVKKDEF